MARCIKRQKKTPEFPYGKDPISGLILKGSQLKKQMEKYPKWEPKWIMYGKISLLGSANGFCTAKVTLFKMIMCSVQIRL